MFAGCWICGSVLDEFHVDHVKPLSKGGWHCLSNLRPCCPSCNLRKGAKWPITEFVTSIRTESVVAS
ncbi:HNH endonuclease [Dietzia sp. NPDC055877]